MRSLNVAILVLTTALLLLSIPDAPLSFAKEPPARSSNEARKADDSGENSSDEKALLGAWCVVKATADGEVDAETKGDIYVFEPSGQLQIFARDTESRCQFRIDSTREPKVLVCFFFDSMKAGAGIYELKADRLHWRTADETQDLNFKNSPQGRWNELQLVAISSTEAKAAIRNLQEVRLRRKSR